VPRPGFTADEALAAAILAFAAEKLARYKLPRRIVFASELPRTASGKLKRGELLATARPSAT
jgi:acyl-coenzyme A synthetase/AMP-(fatty) acid ligase